MPVGLHYRTSSMAEGVFQVYWFEKNLQGDIIALYNNAGTKLANYGYDAWGKLISVADTSGYAITSSTHIANINPFRYRGYYYDTETGLYYLNSRYYDPNTGRFLNADAFIGGNRTILGYNLFAYCDNNPVNYIDLYGYFSWNALKEFGEHCLKAAVIAASVGGAVLAITAAIGGTIGTGGAGAIAIPAAITVAAECMATAAAALTVAGTASVVVGEMGSNISFSKHKGSGGTGYKGRSTYNKDGVRIDYEANGNGTGNVHMKYGNNEETIYRLGQGYTKDLSNQAKKLITNPEIAKAIEKAVKYVEALS